MILLVDDNASVRDSLSLLLQREGFRVETAEDGAQAWSIVRSPDCKCMVLDVNMPRLNGIELLLLMQSENVKVPTILMAGFDDFDEAEMKQFTNVRAFLQKPFSNETLVELIRRHAKKA